MYRISLSATFVFLAVAGCATTGPPESGFLNDYSALVKEKGEEDVWIYHNPKITYAEYQRVIIDPFVVGFSAGKSGILISAKELDKLVAYMHDSVVKIVAEHYPVVEKPGKGTLRLRVALTGLEPATGADSAQAASGWFQNLGISLGGASFEGETRDSVSGERIHAFIVADQTPANAGTDTTRWSQAKRVMEDFGRRFREALDEAHGRSIQK